MKSRLRSAGLFVLLAATGVPHTAAEDGTGPVPDAPEGMVLIPVGEFTMGRTFTTNDDETGMRPLVLRDDRPAHKVRLDAFWMDSTEVTHAAYAEFLAATGRRAPYHWLDGKMPKRQASHPVYNVDWEDARSFCQWKGKRLPTEAEWERAARGGLEEAKYPWGDDSPTSDTARYSTPEGPSAVGKFPANGYGLHDMAGSVAEWCRDWFARTYYSESPSENPPGPSEGMYRIVRGGAWSDGPNRITVFFRNWVRPSQRTPNLGFRCVRDMP
ncbi:MAG: formylglycine-generating enzyme family protein [Bryobacterales bacterium]|nr:formylglycine-generating enzyme family protein [Bryobacterales bacterium]